MRTKEMAAWYRHFDFILIDLFCMQAALAIAYSFRNGWSMIFEESYYSRMAVTLMILQLIVVFFCESYSGIMKRSHFEEFKQTLFFASEVLIAFIIFNYLAKFETDYSRMVIVIVWELGIIFSYLCREWRKKAIHKNSADQRNQKESMLILTDSKSVRTVMKKISEDGYNGIAPHGIILLDKNRTGEQIAGIPVVASAENAVEYLCQNWVDRVIEVCEKEERAAEDILRDCEEMGITVHRALPESFDNGWKKRVENIGGYTVITDSIEPAGPAEAALKRLADIVGGLAGCVITGILFLFAAPAIYINSPGPIFFSQTRIGKNGRKFKIYKFRSMYMDAEERKKELMKQNKVKDGMMFKMDNDPRIIKGIGNFIRKTSIDEFPQFFNVLKGDMSLVGTRPPTVDEWEKYEKHHRVRMAIKPGLTGMWQVSGRSSITDFEEVVALDLKYIREWSIGLDIRILLKTVKIVLTGSGSQ
jgi:exopolysaccharide biosynthesis polyprenyl glycosylphosphotransferase